MKYVMLFILILTSCSLQENTNNNSSENEIDPKNSNWTIMFYLGADNDLEYDLIRNVRDIKESYQGGCNVILFIDRSKYYSRNTIVFGEDFTGPRIYRVLKNNNIMLLKNSDYFLDVSGDPMDSANIFVLKKFIQYCKKEFNSKYYALIIGSHGGGARKREAVILKNVVYDESTDNWIYNKDWENLGISESVDLLGLDACFMGNIEFLYQIRDGNGGFQSRYVVASPPTEWSYGWNYKGIFSRITEDSNKIIGDVNHPITNEKKRLFSSSLLTPKDLGKIIIEEHYDYTYLEADDQILCFYDTSKIEELKKGIDQLFVSLKDNSEDIATIRGSGSITQQNGLFYFDSTYVEEWIYYCYFDIYDLADRIILSNKFSNDINNKAEIVKQRVIDAILYSFSGSYFERFKNNITGISIFLPDGNRLYNGEILWSYQSWYNAKNNKDDGGLFFCRDGAIEGNGIIENYFEVLDYWFDNEQSNGGMNNYSY